MDAVHRYEGTVCQALGDGIMALFGAPIAHEDHALRACYAALALQDGMRRYADEARRTQGALVEVRVGLSSGDVVVRLIGNDLHMDYTAVGQTVHLASRLERLAREGTCVLSAETLALVEGYVEVRALGPVAIKGFAKARNCSSWSRRVVPERACRRVPHAVSLASWDGRPSSPRSTACSIGRRQATAS